MIELEKLKEKDSGKIKFFIGLFTVLLIIFMFPKGESIESEVSIGSIWTQNDLIADFSFPVKKDLVVYNDEIKRMESGVYPIYLEVKNARREAIRKLRNYNKWFTASLDSNLNNDTSYINNSFLTRSSFNLFKGIRKKEINVSFDNTNTLNQLFLIVQTILNDINSRGIINEIPPKANKDSIAVRKKSYDRIIPLKRFYSVNTSRNYALERLSKIQLPEEIKNALFDYLNNFITPTLLYQVKLTEKEIDQARSNVSLYSNIVNENERIVGTHDRITKEVKAKIDSYRDAKGEMLSTDKIILQFIGKFLHISLIIVLLIIYLLLFRKKIFYDNQKIFLLSINLIFLSFITFLVNKISINAPLQFLIFIPAAS
ncbi:MAG: hydrolase, partial [Bacteroidetes bacterium]|nr:hydrolase [Bacteroidota bacterium]